MVVCCRTAMECRTLLMVRGFVVVACAVRHSQWLSVVFVLSPVELSNRLTTDALRTLCALAGFPRCDSVAQSTWSLYKMSPSKCTCSVSQEPKDISSSSTTPWPTSKTANELVYFILHIMLWTVYCVMCILCRLFYIVLCACTVHSYVTVCFTNRASWLSQLQSPLSYWVCALNWLDGWLMTQRQRSLLMTDSVCLLCSEIMDCIAMWVHFPWRALSVKRTLYLNYLKYRSASKLMMSWSTAAARWRKLAAVTCQYWPNVVA